MEHYIVKNSNGDILGFGEWKDCYQIFTEKANAIGIFNETGELIWN